MSLNNTSSCPSADDLAFYGNVSYWTEGILEIGLCFVGLVANCVAIPILCSKKMSSTFNRLLVFLSIFDNVFIFCCVLESVRKYHGSCDAHLWLFVHVLYQAQNVAMCCSIYTTLSLAVERYIAVSRPVEYHIMVNATAGSPWRRVWWYMAPTVAFSLVFSLPKFFELDSVWTREVIDVWSEERSEYVETNVTYLKMRATELRLDQNYIYFYVNLAKFVVTGIVPFAGLVFLNSGIHR